MNTNHVTLQAVSGFLENLHSQVQRCGKYEAAGFVEGLAGRFQASAGPLPKMVESVHITLENGSQDAGGKVRADRSPKRSSFDAGLLIAEATLL